MYGGAYLDGPVGGAGDEDTGVEGVPSHRVHRHVVALVPAQPRIIQVAQTMSRQLRHASIFGTACWYRSERGIRLRRRRLYVCVLRLEVLSRVGLGALVDLALLRAHDEQVLVAAVEVEAAPARQARDARLLRLVLLV